MEWIIIFSLLFPIVDSVFETEQCTYSVDVNGMVVITKQDCGLTKQQVIDNFNGVDSVSDSDQ